MTPVSPRCYQVVYQPQPALLRGTVLCELSDIELTESCELVLAVAQEHGCPFWLLDGRADQVGHATEVYDWMREEFLPRAYQVLGRVPCVAFLAHPNFWQQLKGRGYVPTDPIIAAAAFRTGWFECEVEAEGWLAQFRPTIGIPDTQEAPPVAGGASELMA
jgi:hypothetical protein